MRQNFNLSFELKQKQIWISELWVRNQQRVVSLLQRSKAQQYEIRLKPVKQLVTGIAANCNLKTGI